jgi:hypothetical protein
VRFRGSACGSTPEPLSAPSGGPGFPWRSFQLQNKPKPLRSQPITVAALTMKRAIPTLPGRGQPRPEDSGRQRSVLGRLTDRWRMPICWRCGRHSLAGCNAGHNSPFSNVQVCSGAWVAAGPPRHDSCLVTSDSAANRHCRGIRHRPSYAQVWDELR